MLKARIEAETLGSKLPTGPSEQLHRSSCPHLQVRATTPTPTTTPTPAHARSAPPSFCICRGRAIPCWDALRSPRMRLRLASVASISSVASIAAGVCHASCDNASAHVSEYTLPPPPCTRAPTERNGPNACGRRRGRGRGGGSSGRGRSEGGSRGGGSSGRGGATSARGVTSARGGRENGASGERGGRGRGSSPDEGE